MTDIIYLSGPITDNPDFFNDFRIAEEIVHTRFASAVVVNPARTSEGISCLDGYAPYEVYMMMDIAMLDHCTAIVMLPGYEKSAGAVQELTYATLHGLKIYKMEEDYGIEEC